jgi:hypothetical protein
MRCGIRNACSTHDRAHGIKPRAADAEEVGEMAHHVPAAGPAGESRPEDEGPRASVRARVLPPQLERSCDELFEDADRHGPRWPVLVARVVPAAVLLPLALASASIEPWRRVVIDAASADVADLVLVAPALVAIVLLAAALAPLARVRVEPLLAVGALLLAIGTLLARDGALVLATAPAVSGALLLGIAASRAVRRAVWALPLLLAAGVSDAQSVRIGVTGRLLDDVGARGSEQVHATLAVAASQVARVDLLAAHVPAATGTWLLGLVDVVGVGLLLGLAHLFWLPLGRSALALSIALAAAVAVGAAVPVLPLLGLAGVLANSRLVWRSTRISLRRLTYLGG